MDSLFEPRLGQRVMNESIQYSLSSSSSQGKAGTPSKKGLSNTDGVESIRIAQRCIKQALSILSAGTPSGATPSTPSNKENATPSKNRAPKTPSAAGLSTPVKAKLSKGKTAECSDLLCSAAHVLRCAIGQNPTIAQSYEASVGSTSSLALEKICYHTLVACVDLISSLHQQNVCGTPTTPNASVSFDTAVGIVKACQVAMATYEMLGLLVKNYVKSGGSTHSDSNVISLPSFSNSNELAPHSHFTFAVPPLPSNSFTTGSGEFDKQLCKIVAGASINAARCASELALLSSLPPPPFNFGQAFDRELKLLSKDPFAGSTILYSVALTYIQVMVMQGQVREAASYKERSHKFLWSFASRYDKFLARRSSRSTPNKNLVNNEKMCLEMRRRSVLMLVASPFLTTGPCPPPLSGSHVEASCSASTRAVGNYIQRCNNISVSHCSSPSSALAPFNQTVGRLIDFCAGKMTKAAPPSFSEYCAWRIVSSPSTPHAFISSIERLDKSGYAALRILLTVNSITSPSSNFDSSSSFSEVSNVVDTLRSLCLNADGKTNARNYRILTASKLSGYASNVISSPDTTDSSTKYIIAFVLKQIFAPLSKFSSSLAPHMDCLLKSAALFDLCVGKGPLGAPNSLEMAQQCMNAAFTTISTPGKLNSAAIVNCGKGFAAIGRKRFENQNYVHSVLPILMSLHCFEKDPSSQQLHLRYAMLGSSLKQCNMFRYAAVAYAVAAKSAICSDRNEQELESLVAASLYASGAIEGGATGAIVTNLINCVASAENATSKPKQLPPSTQKILDSSSVGKVYSSACTTGDTSIAKMLKAVVSGASSNFHYAFNLSLCDVLRQLGRMTSNSNTTIPKSLLAKHIAEVYNATNSDDTLLQCNAQLVYARSMMVAMKHEEKKMKALYKLSRTATVKLKESNASEPGHSPLFAAASSILNAELGISLKGEKGKVASYLDDALDICQKCLLTSSRSSLCTVITNLQNFFTFLRDTVKSSQCATMLSKCGSEPKQGVLEFISNAYLHAGMNDLAANIDAKGDVGEIVLKIRECGVDDIGGPVKDLYEMLRGVEDEIASDGGERAQWKAILICAALSEAEEKRANPAEALFYTRKAVVMCKAAIRNGEGRKWLGALVESLTNMGRLWGLLGDKRRAEGYLVAAGECLGLAMDVQNDVEVVDLDGGNDEDGEDDDGLSDFNYDVVRDRTGSTSNELLVEHVSKKMRLLAMPPEATAGAAKKELEVDLAKEIKSMDIERNIEVVLGLLSQGDALKRICEGYDNGFVSKYNSAKEVLSVLMGDELGRQVEKAIDVRTDSTRGADDVSRLGSLKCRVDVRLARAKEIVVGWGDEVEEMYESVRGDKKGHGRERTAACYRLGRARLMGAEGELQKLWSGGQSEPNGNVWKARELFLEASKICGPGTSSLGRKVYRCLGLVAGPRGDFGEDKVLGGVAAVINLHKSLGASVRMNVWYNLGGEDGEGNESDEVVRSVFGLLDDQGLGLKEGAQEMERVIKEYLPEDWNIVNLAVCPGGEVLIGSLRKKGGEVVGSVGCVIECGGSEKRKEGTFLMRSFDTLDLLLEKSRRQLDGIDPAMAKKFGEKEKREWWRQRQDIDDGLKTLMEDVQRELIEVGGVDAILLGEEKEEEVVDDLSKKFEAACVVDLTSEGGEEEEELTEKDIKKMTVAVLKENILDRDEDASLKGLKKAGLQELLLGIVERRKSVKSKVDACEKQYNSKPSTTTTTSKNAGDGRTNLTIILTLDERLQRLPWESMPMLEKRSVCRVPSLPFTLAPVIERKGKVQKIRKKECFYILDPEDNLPTTKKTLNPVLESYAGQKGWGWKGYVGRIPDLQVLERLEKEDGLMVYCGHGGAECCFPRVEVEERLMNKRRGCKSSVFLFGCSSGRLSSGGGAKRGIGSVFKQMEYEPDGVATSYLGAGAPCVLGNLWDVSDRDIDRFCIEFMEKFFAGGKSVAQCVSESRGVCKMRYVVGAAVVVYGVPIVFE